jgi:hypothetical protein
VWFLAAWLAILALTMTQSFAVSGYGPFGIALLAALPFVGAGRGGGQHDPDIMAP